MYQRERPTIHFEAGVHYFRIQWPSLQEVLRGWQRLQYVCIHVPTGNRYQQHAYIEGPPRRCEADLDRLIGHWSASMPKMWSYETGTV